MCLNPNIEKPDVELGEDKDWEKYEDWKAELRKHSFILYREYFYNYLL